MSTGAAWVTSISEASKAALLTKAQKNQSSDGIIAPDRSSRAGASSPFRSGVANGANRPA